MTQASLDAIIEKLQSCIVDARAMQLKMLERILSMALLEASGFEDSSDEQSDHRC